MNPFAVNFIIPITRYDYIRWYKKSTEQNRMFVLYFLIVILSLAPAQTTLVIIS